MAELRMFTVSVKYDADVMLKLSDEGQPNYQGMADTITNFGARDVIVQARPYTGAGTHEFVGSTDPGLAHLAICVKCAKRRSEAAENCPGVGKSEHC